MTKMKSKKMTKSAFAMIIMAIVMVAMIAFGGTYAYFSAQSAASQASYATTAKVKIGKLTEIATSTASPLVPGATPLTETMNFTHESTTQTYVFVKVESAISGAKYVKTGDNTYEDLLKVELDDSCKANWTLVSGKTNVYFATVEAWDGKDETTNDAIPAFVIKVSLNENTQAHYDADDAEETTNVYATNDGNGDSVDIMGKTLTLSVELSAIQTTKQTSPATSDAAYTASITTTGRNVA